MLSVSYLILCVITYSSSSAINENVNEPQCIEPNDYDESSTPSITRMLDDAHKFMDQHNASTFIAYLNEKGGGDDIEATRNYIYKYFLDTFDLYFSLFDNIKEEYFWDNACKLRWPIGWYLGHTASFYNNKLRMNNIINRNESDIEKTYKYYDYLFAQGTDEMHWFDYVPQYDTNYWPTVENVKIYCKNTRDVIKNIILSEPLHSLPINKSMRTWWTILMGIEHERIHLETSAMLIRQFDLNKFKEEIGGIWSNEYPQNQTIPPSNEFVEIQPTLISYGRGSNLLKKDSDGDDAHDFFGWDTEYGEYTVNVSSFNVSKYMVSNYEYYQFWMDDGYKTMDYWTNDGWRWLTETNTTKPKFWSFSNSNNVLKLRNLFTEIDMKYAWNRPVITNHYEAQAFIAWKSTKQLKNNTNLRLITEDEWYVLRTLNNNNKNIREWSSESSSSSFPANINFYYFSSEAPVDLFEFGDSGIYDVVGNLHHHTSSIYHPFNDYMVDPLYVDFSTPFFNESYFLMKGGSYLSSGNMAMIYNRCQWFRSHYFQAAGIRYVESSVIDQNELNQGKQTTNEYFKNTDESDELCNEYIHWQYTNNSDDDKNYRQMVIDTIEQYTHFGADGNVLDIGCNVGGVTYELGKYFNHVIGVDDRARFIGIANQMQQNYKLDYVMKDKYGKNECRSISLKELKMENITDKVQFIHDENLDNLLMNNFNTKFDLIIGHNMFERYYENLKQLKLSDILNENGVIILFEDYSWNDAQIDVIEEMKNILNSNDNDTFTLEMKYEFDTTITRQTYQSSRCLQCYNLHCTIWTKYKSV